MSLLDPALLLVVEGNEGQLIGELGTAEARHLYRQGEFSVTGLLSGQLDDHFECVRSNTQDCGFRHLPGWYLNPVNKQ